MSRANDAQIVAALGASGSGKTTYVMAEIRRRRPGRLLVWDTKGEFAREGYAEPVATLGDLVQKIVAAGRRGRFRLAYQPTISDDKRTKRQYDVFCRIAFEAKNLVLVAEELSDVTTASHAVAGWRRCTSQGRTEGLIIYGLSQHPASIDKHFFGNCSTIRTGRLNEPGHVKKIARVLGVPEAEILALRPLQYIERDTNTGKISRGTQRIHIHP